MLDCQPDLNRVASTAPFDYPYCPADFIMDIDP